MKKYNIRITVLFFAIVILLLLPAYLTFAQGKGVGVSLFIGEPSGIGIKGWTSGNIALTANLGGITAGDKQENTDFSTNIDKLKDNFPYKKSYNIDLNGNFLYHFFFFRTRVFPVYVGAGIRFKILFEDDRQNRENNGNPINFGLRACIGWEWLIKTDSSRWGYFIEASSSYMLDPKRMDFGGFTGLRWYFSR